MSLRSRSLTSGFIGGFLKSNRKRRESMQSRVQQLADNTATRDRQIAISDAAATRKAAMAEMAETASLRKQGHIRSVDSGKGVMQDEYQDSYFKEIEFKKWKEATGGTKKSYDDFLAKKTDYINDSKIDHARYRKRQYKDLDVLDTDQQALMDEINQKQMDAGNIRSQTSFDSFFSGGEEERAAETARVTNGTSSTTSAFRDQGTGELERFGGEPTQVKAEPTDWGTISETKESMLSDGKSVRVLLSNTQGYVVPGTDGGFIRVSDVTEETGAPTEKPVERAVYDSNTKSLMSGIIRKETPGQNGGSTITYLQRNQDGTSTDVTSVVTFADGSGDDVRKRGSSSAKPREGYLKQMVAYEATVSALSTVLPSNEGIVSQFSDLGNWAGAMFSKTINAEDIQGIKRDAFDKYNITLEATKEAAKGYVDAEISTSMYNNFGAVKGESPEVDRVIAKALSSADNLYFVNKAAAAIRGNTSKELNKNDITMLSDIINVTGVKAKQAVFMRYRDKFKVEAVRGAVSYLSTSSKDNNKPLARNILEYSSKVGSFGSYTGVLFYAKRDKTTGRPDDIIFVNSGGIIERDIPFNVLKTFKPSEQNKETV